MTLRRVVGLVSMVGLAAAGCNERKTPPVSAAPAVALAIGVVGDPASVSVPQRSSTRFPVRVERDADCTDDIVISLQDPPAGLSGDTVTLPASLTEVAFRIATSGDLPAGPLSVTLVAAACGQTASTNVVVSVTPATCSSQKLINDALAAGEIDYPTSLRYRAYALFNPSALPTCYQGDPGKKSEDRAFFFEATNPALDADVRASLAPYVVRPNDPTSIFQAVSRAAPVGPDATSRGLRAACVLGNGEIERSGWKSARLADPRSWRVWVQCTDNPVEDAALLARGLDMGGRLWDLETALMGPPLLDAVAAPVNVDTAIDLYIAPDGGASPRDPATTVDVMNEDASTISVPPATPRGNGASSFILIGRSNVLPDRFRTILAHEFFHVIQDAYNSPITFNQPTANGPTFEYWWTEASATWAETHFARRLAASETYQQFTDDFQQDVFPLHKPIEVGADRNDGYQSFIWGFFAEQEQGASIIQSSWEALRDAASQEQADQFLDRVFDFKTTFRRFALRNLNFDMPGLLPREERYAQMDTPEPCPGCGVSSFPDNKEPKYADKRTLTGPDFFADDFFVPPLRAAYYRFPVSSTTLKSVIFRFDNIFPPQDVDFDAAVKIGDRWEYRSYTGQTGARFCLEEPEQALQDIIFIVSNHSIPLSGLADGTIQVTASTSGCDEPTDWAGTVDITATGGEQMTTTMEDSFGRTVTTTETTADYHAVLNVETDFPLPLGRGFDQELLNAPGSSVTVTWSFATTTTHTGSSAGCDFRTVSEGNSTMTGDLTPALGARLGILNTPVPGQYRLAVGAPAVLMQGPLVSTVTTTILSGGCTAPPPNRIETIESELVSFPLSTEGTYDVMNPFFAGTKTVPGTLRTTPVTVTSEWSLTAK